MSTTSRPHDQGGPGHTPRSLRASRVVAAVAVLALVGSGCSRDPMGPLDEAGVRRAILTEQDFPDKDGWTSTGVSSESANAPGTAAELSSATGMPAPCRRAFAAWTDADRQRMAGVNNNFTKFSAQDLTDALMVQLAVRSFAQPPTSLPRLREVVTACRGTFTLTPPGGTAHRITIEDSPAGTSDAAGLRITMPVDGRATALVTLVAQRGNNLVQVVGVGRVEREVSEVAQRVLDAQVRKLLETG
ncbi:MAG: hypothetical protein IPI32_00805 [Austwickia sp.]|nr:hypothetical protein [Austwickia sp.]MBK8437499.1 hypothetical protein [Austwickia sp.]MBK9102765.1 hypothetical protein [Austwickia sp.]